MEKHYKISVICTNCDYGSLEQKVRRVQEVPWGRTAKEHLEHQVCPECKCQTLVKNNL